MNNNRFTYLDTRYINRSHLVKKNQSPPRNKSPYKRNSDEDFQKKIDELRIFANLNNSSELLQNKNELSNNNIQNEIKVNINTDNKRPEIIKNTVVQLSSRILTYGIKKTILSDFNSLYSSSNCNDFKIGLNKNLHANKIIFDCFYLFPNIAEINSKNETNIINEKKIEYFENKYDKYDIQYFPIDYFSCGTTIPMISSTNIYSKMIIKNIYWNIFQTINNDKYKENELLAMIPENNDYTYKNIKLFMHFELHSQIPKKTDAKILPYKNDKLKSVSPANTCLYKSMPIEIGTLDGYNSSDIEIILERDISISCALLCIKISVPDYCSEILKGYDKHNKLFCGYIPFSQLIVNFEYDLL